MSDEEVLECARKAVEFGDGAVVLQSGEDPELTCERVAGLVRRIRADSPLAVTLSLGERDDEEWPPSASRRRSLFAVILNVEPNALRTNPSAANEEQDKAADRNACPTEC